MGVRGGVAAPTGTDGLTDLDLHFARLIGRVGGEDAAVRHAAALVSHWTGRGHICLDLVDAAALAAEAGMTEAIQTPPLDAWVAALRASPAVGRPGEFAPLVLDGANRLYLYRYWAYEREVADDIVARLRDDPADVDPARLRAGLDRLFPASTLRPDWQRIAAAASVLRRFTVISGGPGTGKTTTVIRALALLLEQAGRSMRIGLAAPTGKAAARLQAVTRAVKGDLRVAAAVRDAIPDEASTIHRLLGWRGRSAEVRHTRDDPLDLDVVVVDEASMVDLALMAKVMRAIPRTARLILVGDQDQLASVEAGAVLGDICRGAGGFSAAFRRRLVAATGDDPGGGDGAPLIRDAVVQLRYSHRFGAQGGIDQVARLVNHGNGRDAFELLAEGGLPDATWRTVRSSRDLRQALATTVEDQVGEVFLAEGPDAALTALERSRLLCAHRGGPFGVEAVNRIVEDRLEAARLLKRQGTWYRGRPILVTSNDYHLRLFNGDLGIVWPDAEADGPLRVHVRGGEGILRRFAPARLPAHETAFAATVHKSQGSEADRIVLILPAEPSAVMTRELIYTGISRARSRVEVWGTREAFERAVARRITRSSGLRDALWSAAD